MAALANDAISRWNARPEQQQGSQVKGLLAVSFDQRNHGKRKVDDLANEAWRAGNKRHAPDMFSTYRKDFRIHYKFFQLTIQYRGNRFRRVSPHNPSPIIPPHLTPNPIEPYRPRRLPRRSRCLAQSFK